MSGHMRQRHTSTQSTIQITIGIPGNKQILYQVPNDNVTKESLKSFLDHLEDPKKSWDEAKPWEEVAKDRIEKHTKAGLALRGARFRESLSQKELSALTDISQDNISKMENGKRPIGEKTAKKLAAILKTDYRVFLSTPEKATPKKG